MGEEVCSGDPDPQGQAPCVSSPVLDGARADAEYPEKNWMI